MAKKEIKGKPLSYAEKRLTELGLTEKDLACPIGIYRIDAYEQEKWVEDHIVQRIQSGTFNNKFEPTDGPDMVFHYVDLNRRRMTYLPTGAKVEKSLYRVRFENPSLHLDKYGKPTKYKSPPQSGCPIWIPNFVIDLYQNGKQFDTLFITEGELKAEKASKHKMPTIGLMGINNLAGNQTLPKEFQMLIKKCGVKRVCFVMDGDAFDLSDDLADNPTKSASFRPYMFFSAVNNFKDYFSAFSTAGIFLDLFFAYLLKNEANEKGIDDFLAGTLAKEPHLLEGELLKLMSERGIKSKDLGILQGKGKYVELFTLTDIPKSQLKRLWGLHDVKDFYQRYKSQLDALGRFVYYKDAWIVKDANAGLIELASPITADERFWSLETTESNGVTRTKCSFIYNACYKFLNSRNIGRFKMNKQIEYIFIQTENRIVTEMQPYEIKDYVTDFVQRIGEIEVLEMIFRSSNKYLGKESLSNIPYIDIMFPTGERESQHFYFKDSFWKITANGPVNHAYTELDHNVWRDRLKDFSPTITKNPLIAVTIDDDQDYVLHFSEESPRCDILEFLKHTSTYNWREIEANPNGTFPLDSCRENTLSLLTKLTAIGYLMHSFKNPAVAKAVIGMDIKNSEIGTSSGRSGKSLIGTILEQMVMTIIFDGKKKKLTEDDFMLEEVDQRTQCLVFDDVRKELDFEAFFSLITGTATINKKGISKFKLDRSQALKLYFSTNHAISGYGSSFVDRQVLLGFSDYYNEERKPVQVFGKLFFSDEWDPDQWNLFYNLMACCMQLYLQHGIIQGPAQRLEIRKLHQEIGDEFLVWAQSFFANPENVNQPIERQVFNGKVEVAVKGANRWSTRAIKAKLKAFCKYSGFHFNPKSPDESGRHFEQGQRHLHVGSDNKSNGYEYFTVADSKFDTAIANKPADPSLFEQKF